MTDYRFNYHETNRVHHLHHGYFAVIYSEYQEFDTRVKGFWVRVWAVCVMIFVAAVSVVLLMALVWMLWQRE